MSVKIEEIAGSTFYNGVEMPHIHASGLKGQFILDRNWTVSFELDGVKYDIWIAQGFRFDGASIPRALWRLCGHPLEAPRLAAALVHDWLYRAQVTSRGLADEIFNYLCKRVGMPAWRTGPEWAALRAFGWAAWNANHEWSLISQARTCGHLKGTILEKLTK